MSKSTAPESMIDMRAETASTSAVLNARSCPISGKPRARHSRRAWSIVTPVSAATSAALMVGA